MIALLACLLCVHSLLLLRRFLNLTALEWWRTVAAIKNEKPWHQSSPAKLVRDFLISTYSGLNLFFLAFDNSCDTWSATSAAVSIAIIQQASGVNGEEVGEAMSAPFSTPHDRHWRRGEGNVHQGNDQPSSQRHQHLPHKICFEFTAIDISPRLCLLSNLRLAMRPHRLQVRNSLTFVPHHGRQRGLVLCTQISAFVLNPTAEGVKPPAPEHALMNRTVIERLDDTELAFPRFEVSTGSMSKYQQLLFFGIWTHWSDLNLGYSIRFDLFWGNSLN